MQSETWWGHPEQPQDSDNSNSFQHCSDIILTLQINIELLGGNSDYEMSWQRGDSDRNSLTVLHSHGGAEFTLTGTLPSNGAKFLFHQNGLRVIHTFTR